MVGLLVLLVAGCTSTAKTGADAGTAANTPTTATPATATPTASETNGQGSKTIAAPGGGNISQTVPTKAAATAGPVALSAAARLSTGIVVTLASVRAIEVTANGPGEVGGSSLAVTVHVVNGSAQPIDLSSAVVTLLDSKGQVGTPTPASPSAAFAGPIKAQAAADGVYVFNIAKTERNPVNVYVSYSAGAPTAHFVGNAS